MNFKSWLRRAKMPLTRRDEMQILDDTARGRVGQAELSTVRHRSQEQGA